MDIMKPLLLLVVVSMASGLQAPMETLMVSQDQQTRETKNMDPGLFQRMGQQLQFSISAQLSSYKEDIEARFAKLERQCQESKVVQTDVTMLSEDEDSEIAGLVDKFTDQMLRFSESTAENIQEKMVEALNDSLANLDVKLQPLQDDIDNLKSQISRLVTQDEVADLQKKLTALGTQATTQIKEEISKLPTKDDLEAHNDQLTNKLLTVTSAVGNLSTCGDQGKLQLVLEKLLESDNDLEELSGYLRDAEHNSQCDSTFQNIIETLDALKETMAGNTESLSILEDSVKDTKEDFVTRLENLDNVAKTHSEGHVNPTPLPATTPPTTNDADEVHCLDSTFTSHIPSPHICEAAVQRSMCLKEFFSFHCCRTCRDAGYAFAVPRISASREIPVSVALREVMPSMWNIYQPGGLVVKNLRQLSQVHTSLGSTHLIKG